MNPDATITISCDYLVELTDDAAQANPSEPQVIILPPPSHGTDCPPTPGDAAEQGPRR
jgi:hypothetical protein